MTGHDILLGNPRGSLAGITASRNASKAFFRQRVSPVQPNTLAQLGAKSSFGINSSIYRTLSGIDRGSWSNFAKSIYVSRKSANVGQFTGQMAFQSINTSFQNSFRLNRVYNIEVLGSPLPSGFVPEPFLGSLPKAPQVASSGALLDQSGSPIQISVVGVTVTAAGSVLFSIEIGNGDGVDLANFVNANNEKIGFACFISSANPAENMYFRNPEKYLLGYFKHPEAVVPADLDDSKIIVFDTNDVFNTALYQGFPVGDDYVLFSLYLVTESNQMNLVGRLETQIIGVP